MRKCISIGYIPAQRALYAVGKVSACLNGAEEVTRASLRHFPGVTKALAFPKGYNGSYIPLGRDTTNLAILSCVDIDSMV